MSFRGGLWSASAGGDAHVGIVVAEGLEQRFEGAAVADEAQGPRRLQSHRRVLVAEVVDQQADRPSGRRSGRGRGRR